MIYVHILIYITSYFHILAIGKMVNKTGVQEFPGDPVVMTQCFYCQGLCSVPGQRTKGTTCYTGWPKQNRKTNVDFPWGSCSHFGCIPDMDY